jgi:hypothetical protein
MSAAPPDRASYRWLIITLGVAAGVYAWYATNQYYGLNDLNQRQLSNVGAELKDAVDIAVVNVEVFNRRWQESAGQTTGQTRQVCDFVSDFVKSQPYLELRACEADGRSDSTPSNTVTSVKAIVDPTLTIEASGGGAPRQRFRYRTDKLLRELAFLESFALIFIATDKGEVLYEDAPARRQWLRYLRWDEQTFRDTQAERPPTLHVGDLQQVLGGQATWNTLRSVSSRTSITLGGTTHQLYLQPLTLEGDQRINLIIGGAVPRSFVVRDALALGAPLLGILVFVLLLAVLGFPFVKLACLDPHERFTLRDIKLLYVSAGALLVLFTCASLALDGYVRWHVEADRGLEMLAGRLESSFLTELKAIRDQLSKYDADVKAIDLPCDKWDVRTNWFRNVKPDGLGWPSDVHLKTVAWIEPGGPQIWKSTADAVPGKLSVGNRVYFRAVRDGNLFTIDGQRPAIFVGPDRSITDGKFYTFVSMPSAIDHTRCAQPEWSTSGLPVLAATAQLLSLDRQVLPAGYGFTVVNREGRVLYHSDARLSLRENLYEELSEGARARAMIYAASRARLDTRYHGRPHTFFLRPIGLPRAGDEAAETRFYLAAFRDTSVEQALVGHVFVVGLFGPMALLLIMSGAVLAFLGRASRYTNPAPVDGAPSRKSKRGPDAVQHDEWPPAAQNWSAWLWPHRGLEHIYKRQAIAFLSLLIVSTGIYSHYGTVVPFLLSAVLAPILGVLIYRYWKPQKGTRGSLSNSIWQRASVLLVLVCMIVVPSAALFRLALSHEFAKLILTEREWITAQRDDWLRAARVEALENGYAEQRFEQLKTARGKYVGCVPSPFDAEEPTVEAPSSVDSCPAPSASAAYVRSLAKLEPMGMGVTVVEALRWFDEMLPIENEILARQHFQPYADMYSPDGTILPWFRASGIAFGGFALTLGLLTWWISWNSNHVFLADLDASGRTPTGTCEQIWARYSSRRDAQMVLLQLSRERIANPHQRRIIKELLDDGVLDLKPDVQPFSAEFDEFVRNKALQSKADIQQWEDVNVPHSWRYGRLILVALVAGIGFFLIATQPGLQSSVMTIATGITGLVTAGSKLRDALTTWIARKGTS